MGAISSTGKGSFTAKTSVALDELTVRSPVEVSEPDNLAMSQGMRTNIGTFNSHGEL